MPQELRQGPIGMLDSLTQGPDMNADAYRGGILGKLLAKGIMGLLGGPSRQDVLGPSVLQQQAQWSDQTRGLPVADRLRSLSPMAENLGMNAATVGNGGAGRLMLGPDGVPSKTTPDVASPTPARNNAHPIDAHKDFLVSAAKERIPGARVSTDGSNAFGQSRYVNVTFDNNGMYGTLRARVSDHDTGPTRFMDYQYHARPDLTDANKSEWAGLLDRLRDHVMQQSDPKLMAERRISRARADIEELRKAGAGRPRIRQAEKRLSDLLSQGG